MVFAVVRLLSFRPEDSTVSVLAQKGFDKVGAMLLTILNTSRAISFTLCICRYSAPAVLRISA